jgi:uncharacterized protein YwlG (UPF0340 family)
MNYDKIRKQMIDAAEELIKEAYYTRPGDIFVLGCSTSEVLGVQIGKGSSQEVGSLIIETLIPIVKTHGLNLAVQGCEQYDAEVCVVVDKFENFIESRQLHISGFIDFYVKNHG